MTLETFKKLRVMVLCHEDLVPPETIEGLSAKEIAGTRPRNRVRRKVETLPQIKITLS